MVKITTLPLTTYLIFLWSEAHLSDQWVVLVAQDSRDPSPKTSVASKVSASAEEGVLYIVQALDLT